MSRNVECVSTNLTIILYQKSTICSDICETQKKKKKKKKKNKKKKDYSKMQFLYVIIITFQKHFEILLKYKLY